jgi:hypothetical protein
LKPPRRKTSKTTIHRFKFDPKALEDKGAIVPGLIQIDRRLAADFEKMGTIHPAIPCRFLIDTGATISHARKVLLRAIPLQSVGLTKEGHPAWFARVTVGFEPPIEMHIPLAERDLGNQDDFDGLLGRNFMLGYSLNFNFATGDVSLEKQ